jgi:ribonuclease BN (tRNA processing enzyme)
MKLRVLGCYGGSAPGMHPTCFLVDERLAFDAGALTQCLSVTEQACVDHVFLSHAHLDHLATLPFLVDNVFCMRDAPVRVHGSEHALDCLREHVFNEVLWPDFTRIENGRTALLEYSPLEPGGRVEVGGLTITAMAMEHTVPCSGYLIQGPESSLALCGDTEGVEAMAAALPAARGLVAIILEASFPAAEVGVAKASGHLTSEGFARSLKRLPRDLPVWVTHIKPTFVEEVRREIEALGDTRVHILEQGREYSI